MDTTEDEPDHYEIIHSPAEVSNIQEEVPSNLTIKTIECNDTVVSGNLERMKSNIQILKSKYKILLDTLMNIKFGNPQLEVEMKEI